MGTFFRNTISKLCNAVSAPMAVTRDALAERLQAVHETVLFLLYNRMMENTWTTEIERHHRKRSRRRSQGSGQRATARRRRSQKITTGR